MCVRLCFCFYIFACIFNCISMCVCVFTENLTPLTPFWMKRVLRERRVQPTTWQGRRGVLGWGRMEGQGGWRVAAARILKETVGEWGGLSPLVTSQHAQPREFAVLDSQSQSTPCKAVCRMTQCSYLVVMLTLLTYPFLSLVMKSIIGINRAYL